MARSSSDHFSLLAPAHQAAIRQLPPRQDVRYEVKFSLTNAELPHALGWVTTHACGFRKAFPDRFVNNIYMDTADLQAYEENAAGIGDRDKLRFRWYGDTWAASAGTLEVKCRSDSVGWKWTARVLRPFDLEHATWQQFRDTLRGGLDDLFVFLLDQQPFVTLVNRYLRSYFVSRDGRVRLTIDREIQSFPQLGRARPALRFAAHRAQAVVLEVKCAVDDRPLAARVLKDIPWRAARHSKYATGIESIDNL